MIYLELAKRFWPFILAIVLFGTGYGYGHHNDHKAMQAKQDALQQEFSVFKADVQAQAIIAQKASDETKAKQEKEKQDADQDYNVRIAALNADVARLRLKDNSHSNVLPAPSPTTSNPSGANLQRAEYESAHRILVDGLRSVGLESDQGIEGLNSVKVFAQKP